MCGLPRVTTSGGLAQKQIVIFLLMQESHLGTLPTGFLSKLDFQKHFEGHYGQIKA